MTRLWRWVDVIEPRTPLRFSDVMPNRTSFHGSNPDSSPSAAFAEYQAPQPLRSCILGPGVEIPSADAFA